MHISSYDDDDDDDDGTMIALTAEGIVEALNTGVKFPMRTFMPTKPLVICLPMGVQTIMSINLTMTM